ncbi:hypothetical protein V5E97_36980 [Singulisphaera sp. Ch08]|uniref:Uncharacterized protein n=1 Tax=Singulisphaera sp. Ch08 TaxID=3120278 RepID=A0AAU7CFD0_9BACT
MSATPTDAGLYPPSTPDWARRQVTTRAVADRLQREMSRSAPPGLKLDQVDEFTPVSRVRWPGGIGGAEPAFRRVVKEVGRGMGQVLHRGVVPVKAHGARRPDVVDSASQGIDVGLFAEPLQPRRDDERLAAGGWP